MSELHITSGDFVGEILAEAGFSEIFVWHDILYDGPRNPGWPTSETLEKRADFLERHTGGGLSRDKALAALEKQYDKISDTSGYGRVILWFDACLFDLSMLAHILTCLKTRKEGRVDLICIDSFPGIEPFDGLGQLTSGQLAPYYDKRLPVSSSLFAFAEIVDRGIALRDRELLTELAGMESAPLPNIPEAMKRLLAEIPEHEGDLGQLERLALAAISSGKVKPCDIFRAVAASDSRPQFWGDTTLWEKINSLSERQPPLVSIKGPEARLPQWGEGQTLTEYSIYPAG